MDLKNARVPIVGQQRKLIVCPQGHVDELPGVFTMNLPNPDGSVLKVATCRICMVDWISQTMPAREATPEEEKQIRAAMEAGSGGPLNAA